VTDGFRRLPLVFRVCVAVGLAFALTQAEAAYDRHRDYGPIARAEDRASGQPVTTLPYGEVERWLTASVDEGSVRDRWREGNTAFEEAYVAVAGGTGDDSELRGDRCYVFPVTGEVRTRLRGTVALAAFCFEGEAPAPAPVEVGLEEVTGA
jgi:hypothetical protein